MKTFCEFLKEHKMEIIYFIKKKIIPLTNKEYELYISQINCHICKRSSNINTLMIKIIVNSRIIIIMLLNTEVQHIVYVIEIIVYMKKFLQYSTTDQTMLIIVS